MATRKSDTVGGGSEHSGENTPDAPDHDATLSGSAPDAELSPAESVPEVAAYEPVLPAVHEESVAETVSRIDETFPDAPDDVPPPSSHSIWPPEEPVAVADTPEPEPEPEPEPVIAESEPAPMLATAEERHEEHEHEEDEAGPSIAARLLTLLVAVLAGAGFGVWLAPKLAPRLPAGMAPVAEWLTPGQQDAETKLAALQAALDEKISEVDARVAALPGTADVDAKVAAAVAASAAKIEDRVTSLQDTVTATAGSDAQGRIAQLESAIQGQVTELASLRQQLSSVPVGAAADAPQNLDAYQAQIDGVKATVGTLGSSVATLSSRLDEVSAAADRQVQAAQDKVEEVAAVAATQLSAAQVEADMSQIRGALATGLPFDEPLKRLAEQPGVTVPAGLTAAAEGGVATQATLLADFPDAAHAAIRASIGAAAGGGVLDRAEAYLKAQVASRSLTPQEGDGTDAVLSRMEDKLRAEDLEAVLAEAGKLPSEAVAAMQGWLDKARARAAADDGFAALGAALTTTSN